MYGTKIYSDRQNELWELNYPHILLLLSLPAIGQHEYITSYNKLINVCLGQSFQISFILHHYYKQNSKLLVNCKHLIKIN